MVSPGKIVGKNYALMSVFVDLIDLGLVHSIGWSVMLCFLLMIKNFVFKD